MQAKMLKQVVHMTFAASLLVGAAVGVMGSVADAAEVTKLAVLTPEDPTDYGWNQQGHDAAKAVAEKYGLEFLPATGLGYGDVRPTLRELAGEGASLMIAHASGYNTAAPEIAEETKVPVAIVDRPDANKPGLIADSTLSGHEGAYLAGILAAKMTTTGAVGIVTSGEPPSWNSQSAAFAEGAKAANPGIKLIYAVIGPAAYSDAAGGRRVTETVIGAGADVIFGQGDGASFGMLQAVETTKAPNGNQAWFIDVIGDKTAIDKGFLLSSVIWNMEPVYSAMVEDLKADTFGTKGYAIGLADDSVKLLKSKYIPEDVWTELMKTRDDIIGGSLKVEPIWDAEAVRALMTETTINEE